MFILLHLDDVCLPFDSREDLILGTHICVETMAKFGLTIHAGLGTKSSKTESMCFPSAITLHECKTFKQALMSDETTSHSTTIDTISLSTTNFDEKCEFSPHTRACNIRESGHYVPFVKQFNCIGTIIDYLLDDTIDVKKRISQAKRSVGALSKVYKSTAMSLETKVKLYLAISVNLNL